ncbi:unnamed protein product [Clavelina lepadiformis]|uniref:ADF-H domain-containing protein n=1 Tax=Clavelina lepadiformis TaxID=159417 RepID=A0ABP0GL98_CLALP
MASGIKIEDETKTEALKCGKVGGYKALMMEIVKNTSKLEVVRMIETIPFFKDEMHFDKVVELLNVRGYDQPAYLLFDCDYVTHDSRKSSTLVFLSWIPDNIGVKQRMLYGSSATAVRQGLEAPVLWECQDLSDLKAEELFSKVGQKKAQRVMGCDR